MAAPRSRWQYIQNGVSHPCNIQLGVQNSSKTIFLCFSSVYKIRRLLPPLKFLPSSPESPNHYSTVNLKCHQASPTFPPPKLRHWHRPPRDGRWAPATARSLRYWASSLLALMLRGRRKKKWVVPPFPLFSVKLTVFFPYVTQICSEVSNWTIAVSMACGGLKFLTQCLLISRASVQGSSSWIHMCGFYCARVSHSYHDAGLTLVPSCISMRSSESNTVVTGGVRGPRCGTHCILSSRCFSPPSCIGPWRIQIPVLCHTLKPWCQPTHPPGVSPLPRRAHQVVPSNKFCGFP